MEQLVSRVEEYLALQEILDQRVRKGRLWIAKDKHMSKQLVCLPFEYKHEITPTRRILQEEEEGTNVQRIVKNLPSQAILKAKTEFEACIECIERLAIVQAEILKIIDQLEGTKSQLALLANLSPSR